MPPYRIINCHAHDYLELACMRGYPLLIETTQGDIQSVAINLITLADKTEYLVVRNGSLEQQIRLDQILAITPLSQPAEFGRVLMTPQDE